MKKNLCVFLSLILTLIFIFSFNEGRAFAQKKLDLKAESSIIYCKTTNEIIHSEAPDKKEAIGEMTKLMTCYIALNKLGQDKVIQVKEKALEVEKKLSSVSPGENITVRDLVYQGLYENANDSIMALVLEVSSDEKAFVRLMNKQAKAWELRNTNFTNATGRIEKGHITTARDLIEMYEEILDKSQEIRTILSKDKETLPRTDLRDAKMVENPNYFLRGGEVETGKGKKEIEPFEIVSHGMISAYSGSKSSMILGINVNGLECYIACLNTDLIYQYSDGRKLLNYAKENVSSYKAFDKNMVFKGGFVKYGAKNKVEAVAEKPGYINLPEGASASLVTTKVSFKKKLTAPVVQGQKVGKVDIYLADEHVSSVDLKAKNSIPKGWFLSGLGISNAQTIIIFVVLFLCLMILILIAYIRAERKRIRAKIRKEKLREIVRKELERENDLERRDWPYR